MRTEIAAYQPGIYPRSEALVAATRDLDRARTSAAAVEARRRQDRAALVELQRAAGLDYLSDGLLAWQDLFRPLVAASAGLTPGPLVRWFDNNTFFRAPVLHGPPRLDPEAFLQAAGWDGGIPGPRVATLPGPFTFARVTRGGRAGGGRMLALAREVLRPAAEALAARGCALLHLEEPWLAAGDPGPDGWALLERALAAVREGLGARVVVHTFFGDAGPRLARLRSLPVDAVGVDLVETDAGALAGPWRVGLLLGCLDGRSSLLESVEATVAVARRVLEAASPPLLLLSSSCALEFLPRATADRKVQLLGTVRARLREELAC